MFSQEFIDDVALAFKQSNELYDENKKLRRLLQDALPHIECKNNSQSGPERR